MVVKRGWGVSYTALQECANAFAAAASSVKDWVGTNKIFLDCLFPHSSVAPNRARSLERLERRVWVPGLCPWASARKKARRTKRISR